MARIGLGMCVYRLNLSQLGLSPRARARLVPVTSPSSLFVTPPRESPHRLISSRGDSFLLPHLTSSRGASLPHEEAHPHEDLIPHVCALSPRTQSLYKRDSGSGWQ